MLTNNNIFTHCKRHLYLCKRDLFLCLLICWLICQDALSFISLRKQSGKRLLSVQMRPISVFTLMLTRLSRCSIVTLFVEILCPSALSLPAPLLMAYYLHLQITYIMICTHASLMLLYLRKSRIYGQITWIYEQITYIISVTEITDNFIFVERERREMLEDTTMSTDKSLIHLQRSERISTWCQHLQFGAFWGALRQQILEYLDRGNFVVHYLYIKILRTVFAPSGAFIQIERLRLRQVWSMMTCSKHINREKPWLLTCKNHTNSRTLFFLSKKMLLCRDVRQFLYQFDDRKK